MVLVFSPLAGLSWMFMTLIAGQLAVEDRAETSDPQHDKKSCVTYDRCDVTPSRCLAADLPAKRPNSSWITFVS